MSELDFLAKAQNGGKFGFQVQQSSADGTLPGDALITIGMPSFMARVWTLNLLAFRFTQTPLPVSNGLLTTNGQPPDNQTYNSNLKVRLDYGVDSASDSVRFDYPSRGCTVQFHAAVIRIYLQGSIVGFGGGQPIAPPLLGGFIAPHARGNVAADMLPSCVLTEDNPRIFNGPGAAAQFAWAPQRARGYRLVPIDALAVATPLSVSQVNFNQTIISIDYDAFTGLLEPLVQTRQAFAPMLPDAQGIRISSAVGAAQTATYRVQWLLDIG